MPRKRPAWVRTAADEHILDLLPEYRAAEAIGNARRALADALEGHDELKLTAWLYHQGFSIAALAHLFGLAPSTIERKLATWKRQAGLSKRRDENRGTVTSTERDGGPPKCQPRGASTPQSARRS